MYICIVWYKKQLSLNLNVFVNIGKTFEDSLAIKRGSLGIFFLNGFYLFGEEEVTTAIMAIFLPPTISIINRIFRKNANFYLMRFILLKYS